jgi:hypothetical protein
VAILKPHFEKNIQKSQLILFCEVLTIKVFSQTSSIDECSYFFRATMQLVLGGLKAIVINSEDGSFFINKKRVHKGTPSRLRLFDFIVYDLAGMLDKTKSAGHIQRVVPI